MRPFTDYIRDYNAGKFAEEMTETMNRLVADVIATGKKGSITLKVELRPGKSSQPSVHLLMDYVDKSPDFDRPAEYMYVNNANDMVRDNPSQRRLELREVNQPPLPAHDPLTGEVLQATSA